MIVETTLENWKSDERRYYRKVGNTTRLIDHAIQLLYEGKTVLLLDHYEHGHHQFANENLKERLLRRLVDEHGITKKDISIKDAKLFPFKHHNGTIEMIKYPAEQAVFTF